MTRRVNTQFELPARPEMLTRLSAEISRPSCNMATVASIVESDPGIAAAVLRVVNSSYYGLSRVVASVEAAVNLIGTAELYPLAAEALLKQAFPPSSPEVVKLWELSARLAERAGAMAKESGVVPRDIAYTYGLFRYIGCAVMLAHTPGYKTTFDQFDSPDFPQAERLRHGVHHGQVASSLVVRWGMSRYINEALVSHSEVELLPYLTLEETSRRLIALGAMAEMEIRPVAFKNADAIRAVCAKYF